MKKYNPHFNKMGHPGDVRPTAMIGHVGMLGIIGAVASSLDRHTRDRGVTITIRNEPEFNEPEFIEERNRVLEAQERKRKQYVEQAEAKALTQGEPELSRQARRAKERARAKGTPVRNRNTGQWEYK